MKISIVADLHLNKNVYKGVMDREFPQLPFRTGDFMRSFRFIVNKTINIKPDLFVINGDVYEHFEPTNEVRGFFSSQLKLLVAEKIPVIILIGNHDVCRKHHALKDIQELGLKSIKVIETPTVLEFKEHLLCLFPYSLDIERGNVTTKQEFNKFLKIIEKKDTGLNKLFFGHFGVQDAILNQYTEEEDMTDTTTTTTTNLIEQPKVIKAYRNRNKNDITMDDLDKIGAEYVFLGDFHKYQVLDTKKCISLYSGSIERNNFSESEQDKGFVLYDTEEVVEGSMGCCRFIKYDACRPMIELKGNMDEIRAKFDNLDSAEYQEGIFKMSFYGTSEELISFSTRLDELKQDINEKMKAIHIFHKQKIKNEEMDELASKVEKEIEEKGHIDQADVIDVVREIIKEKISDEDECNATIDLAEEIYKTTMEKE